VFFIVFLVLVNSSIAATKEEEEKSLVAMEVFNKFRDVAANQGDIDFFMDGRDSTRMSISSAGNIYKIKYAPTSFLDITMDYDRSNSQITSGTIQSRLLDTPEKIEFYRNNFLILAKLIDNKLSTATFNNIFKGFDLNKVRNEPRFFISVINNDYFYNIDAYSRKTQIFTVKIRKSNKIDNEEINLAKDMRDNFNNALAALGKSPQWVYPEVVRSTLKIRNLFFYSSANISMNVVAEMGFLGSTPISGSAVYESQKANDSKQEDFSRDSLILILLTNPKLSADEAKGILNNFNIADSINNLKYYKSVPSKTNVYTLSYIKGKLTFAVDVRNAEYDRKARIESLIQKSYNSIITEFNLDGAVQPLTAQDLTIYILNKQNVVVFRPAPLLLFRVYLDDASDSILRINIVIPKVAVDKNLELQKNNSLIAIGMLNPSATRNDAEEIFNYLKNAYGAVETRVVGDFRFKRCTYKDETLVFSKYDAKEVFDDNSQIKDSANAAAYNPNLLYEPETTSPSGTVIAKPQPLCY